VVVVTVDGTRLADWRSRDLFAFGSLMRRGALGLASTRTATIEGRVGRMRREAYRAFGSGRVGARSSAELLASSLTRAGVSTVIMASGIEGSSSLSRTAIATPERMDGSFPGGR